MEIVSPSTVATLDYQKEQDAFVRLLSTAAAKALWEVDRLIERHALDGRAQAMRRKSAFIEHLMAAELSHRLLDEKNNGRAKADLLARMMAIKYPSQAELGIRRKSGRVLALSLSRRKRIAARLRPQSRTLADLQQRLEELETVPGSSTRIEPQDVRTDQEVLLVRTLQEFAGGALYRLAAILLADCYRIAGREGGRCFAAEALKARERRFRAARRAPIDLRLTAWCFSEGEQA